MRSRCLQVSSLLYQRLDSTSASITSTRVSRQNLERQSKASSPQSRKSMSCMPLSQQLSGKRGSSEGTTPKNKYFSPICNRKITDRRVCVLLEIDLLVPVCARNADRCGLESRQENGDSLMLKEAQQNFQIFGASAANCDTIPSRQWYCVVYRVTSCI
jgi:hypothetical protein